MANEKTPNRAAKRPSEEYLNQYVRLRTALDSLESMALHYSLAESDEKERIKRAKKVERLIAPVAKEIMNLSKPKAKKKTKALMLGDGGRGDVPLGGSGDPCPQGFCLCNGLCVPYNC